MDKLIFKTKFSFIGLILTGLIFLLAIYLFTSNPISIKMTLLLIALVLSSSIPQFVASPTLELYEDYFKIAYPLLFFLSGYKKRKISYSDVDYIEYCYRIREPSRLVIYFKNKRKQKLWFRFRYFSGELAIIGKLLQDKNINVSYRRFRKTQLMK